MDRKGKISRVDVQVSLIISIIVITSFICVYFFHYTITYKDMVSSLKKRSDSIYNYVENYVDKSTFIGDLNAQDAGYITTKEKLENVKVATNVRYLYTAKQKDDGSYVYLVDGLPSDSADFRNPNDAIEPEIIPELQRALKNEIIVPDTIKKTTWGEIFVSYYPIHDGDKVIGVLGMEFDASDQYRTFRSLRIGTPIIAIIACIIAVFIAGKLFKRISNPNYKDMANTDYLTKLKNRNAFMIDIHNRDAKKQTGCGLLVADMNDLKKINDTYGHQAGDVSICAIANLLSGCAGKHPTYRIGGDEFVMIVDHTDMQTLEDMKDMILEKMEHLKLNHEHDLKLSLSVGIAMYDEEKDKTLLHTFKRADFRMYNMKRDTKKDRDGKQ